VDKKLSEVIEDYCLGVMQASANLPFEDIAKVIEALSRARDKGKRVYIFGNGGSASTASHFASDLNKGSICKGKLRFKAQCLSDNVPVLTAWANDTSYRMVFAEQVENFIEAGDVVVSISGSGNSPNVLNAVKLAKAKGAFNIGFIGFGGGMLKDLVDLAVVVTSDNMERVEDVHLVICHIIKTCLTEEED